MELGAASSGGSGGRIWAPVATDEHRCVHNPTKTTRLHVSSIPLYFIDHKLKSG